MVIRASRRAVLAGTFAALSTRRAFAMGTCGSAGTRPSLTLGLIESTGPSELEIILAALRGWCDCCAIAHFRSWGSLIDHLTAPTGSNLDAAILPRAALARLDTRDPTAGSFAARPLAFPARSGTASLLFSPAMSGPQTAKLPRPLVVARDIADPLCDARLLSVTRWLDGYTSDPQMIELGAAAMQSNVAAGTVDVALLTGPDAERWTARHERAGLNVRRFSGVDASGLRPPLALVVRPEASGAARSPDRFWPPRMQA